MSEAATLSRRRLALSDLARLSTVGLRTRTLRVVREGTSAPVKTVTYTGQTLRLSL